jgi:putative oxidoreductase
MDIGLLILRLVLGLTMAAHGSQKLFGWFGGYGLAGTGGFFESLGFRPGRTYALIAGLGELVGGLLLALGLLTPLGAALVISVMVAAIGSVHVPKGFWNHNGGYEFNLLVVAAATALAFIGPGAYAAQPAEALGIEAWKLGLGALVVGVLGGGGALMTRHPAAPAHST